MAGTPTAASAMGKPSSEMSANAASQAKRVDVKVPKGGEMHIRHLDNGVMVSSRDANYNRVQEVFAETPEQLNITAD
jgi:hypothetical protein